MRADRVERPPMQKATCRFLHAQRPSAETALNIVEKTDEEIRAIADPLWRDLVKNSNEGKYGEFVKNFSSSLGACHESSRGWSPVRKQRTGQKPV